LGVAHGHGTITGQDPPGSHCNNIGAIHRRQIHELFRRWFNIDVQADHEYSLRRSTNELTCLTNEARGQFQPRPLREVLYKQANERLAEARQIRAASSVPEQRKLVRESWLKCLGNLNAPQLPRVQAGTSVTEQLGAIASTREVLETEPGILVPVITLASNSKSND